MMLLGSGYFQDGLKAIVYSVPLIYLVVKKDRLNLKYFWLFFTGLSLLLFGHLLDFIDEIELMRNLFYTPECHILQDFFEDIVGFTLGFAIFILALYLEQKNRDGISR